MKIQAIIERTVEAINQLPQDKAEEISDFVDFVRKRYEENRLTEEIEKMVAESASFEFLNDEEELYAVTDLKVVDN
ncbi:hypothetical protein [Dyadobacter luticola]|uniref:DUF2281 domain-containing protein n=1 Tax=Dyadobacter luticola TaxID=1979387 RepID=A0A5R9L3A1_9BACT|nr:hypothetical protein [Dyadobacter luticola]TLV02740.1 hypothetical protein FEN17_03725 [Dyadobacter luticola]